MVCVSLRRTAPDKFLEVLGPTDLGQAHNMSALYHGWLGPKTKITVCCEKEIRTLLGGQMDFGYALHAEPKTV